MGCRQVESEVAFARGAPVADDAAYGVHHLRIHSVDVAEVEAKGANAGRDRLAGEPHRGDVAGRDRAREHEGRRLIAHLDQPIWIPHASASVGDGGSKRSVATACSLSDDARVTGANR